MWLLSFSSVLYKITDKCYKNKEKKRKENNGLIKNKNNLVNLLQTVVGAIANSMELKTLPQILLTPATNPAFAIASVSALGI
jgi:hypothetical protein